jgi:hypothetical protein
MIENIGVPHTEVDLAQPNGESVDFARLIQNDNRVAVYPAFESRRCCASGLCRCWSRDSCSTFISISWPDICERSAPAPDIPTARATGNWWRFPPNQAAFY